MLLFYPKFIGMYIATYSTGVLSARTRMGGREVAESQQIKLSNDSFHFPLTAGLYG